LGPSDQDFLSALGQRTGLPAGATVGPDCLRLAVMWSGVVSPFAPVAAVGSDGAAAGAGGAGLSPPALPLLDEQLLGHALWEGEASVECPKTGFLHAPRLYFRVLEPVSLSPDDVTNFVSGEESEDDDDDADGALPDEVVVVCVCVLEVADKHVACSWAAGCLWPPVALWATSCVRSLPLPTRRP
jgi:hypothetical protein